MVDMQVERDTSLAPDLVLSSIKEQSLERRNEIWSNVTPSLSEVHDTGPDFLEITEGTRVAGVFWERVRYEWPDPGRVTGRVIDSNVFKPGSLFELRAEPGEGGGARVAMSIRREFQPGPRGLIAATINHLGGKRLFGWYLGTALKALEKRAFS